MPSLSSPPPGTDIGPTPGGDNPAGLATTPRGADAAGTRKVRADNADPAMEREAGSEAAEASASLPKGNGATEQVTSDAPKKEEPRRTGKQQTDGPAKRDPQEGGAGEANFWPKIDCTKTHEQVEAALYECMKTKYGAALVSDMDDAQLLLSYVTRNALQEDRKVADDIIQTLIASREQLRAGIFDAAADEAKFRKCYATIAKAAQPVAVASLRDSLMIRNYRPWFSRLSEPRPIAEIACLRYRNLAVVVLLVLLGVQIYWTATSSVLGKTDALIAEINKAPSKEFYITLETARIAALEAARIAALKAGNQQQPAATPAAPGISPTAPPLSLKLDKNQLTLDELVSKIGELNANYSILDKFMKPFSWFYFIPDKPAASPGPATEANSKDAATKQTPAKDIFEPSDFQNKSASIRVVAVQVIDVMQKWLLPLLYGALGAMVFVVRTLSMQARDRLFRKEALVSLVLRVFLGMISGLAIGWFWTHDPTPTASGGGPMSLSTLSPFALAFIAGYGVELFFALLDKIVSTFTNKT